MMIGQTATAIEALAVLDAGQPVWTVEMGGLGPGYEQCIQLMAFEMLRAMLDDPLDWAKYDNAVEDDKRTMWQEYSARIKSKPAVKDVIEKLGPSGAQGGAAMNISSIFAKQGYSEGLAMVDEDRRIQFSKNFPT